MKGRAELKTIRVKVRTLDTILATHRPDLEAVDLLVVDVEGWGLNIMRGFSSERYRPKVVVLENLFDEQAYIQYRPAAFLAVVASA